MSRRALGLLVAAVVVFGCAALVWFLLRQHHVDRAGAWAGIIGLAGLPLAVWALWLALRPVPEPPAPQPNVQVNRASKSGTVYAVQEGNQTVHHHRAAGADGEEQSPQ
jgi:hypothetical protein